MANKQKQELSKIEKQILDMGPYCDGRGMIEPFHQWGQQKNDEQNTLLTKRCNLLNKMFECRPDELERFKKVNDRLTELIAAGVRINSFKEVVPRMNDIFIKLVTEEEA